MYHLVGPNKRYSNLIAQLNFVGCFLAAGHLAGRGIPHSQSTTVASCCAGLLVQ